MAVLGRERGRQRTLEWAVKAAHGGGMTLAGRSGLEQALSTKRLALRSLDLPLFDRRLFAYYRVSTPIQERRGLGLAVQRSAVVRFVAKWRERLSQNISRPRADENTTGRTFTEWRKNPWPIQGGCDRICASPRDEFGAQYWATQDRGGHEKS